MSESLGEALPREMARVRDEVLPHYTPEVNGQIAAAFMRSDLDKAARALAEGDVAAMAKAFDALRGWKRTAHEIAQALETVVDAILDGEVFVR